MIDYEVKVFNKVHGKVASEYAEKKFVSTIITKTPTAFPAGSLIEIDNITDKKRQSSRPRENFSIITYQLEVFATTKRECRKAFVATDNAMISMNFNRISGQYINNADNTKVLRYVARYEAEVDQYGNIYRIG